MTLSIGNRTVPKPIAISFWMWIVAAIVGVVSGIFTATSAATATAAAAEQASSGVAIPAGLIVTTTIIGAFIGAALHVLFAFFMIRGRNWARIVLTVLGILSVLSCIAGMIALNPLAFVLAIVTIVAIVQMFAASAREFFAANKR